MMKFKMLAGVTLLLSVGVLFGAEQKQFQNEGNPIFRDAFTADPATLVVGDTLYVYVGHDEAHGGETYNITEWLCYSTKDMQTWTTHGSVLKPTDFKWGARDAWASQVVEKDGKYYYYTTVQAANPLNCKTVGVAVSDSPTGPFVDAIGKPLVVDSDTPGGGWNDIDPTVLIDDDGTAWLCWGNGSCFLAKLKPNMIEIDGEIQQIRVQSYIEGPWLHKRGDIYYLLYAGFSGGSENIRYATAPAVTGPWKSMGELTGNARNSFTIHPAIVEFKGQWYLFYHNATLTLNGERGATGRRSVCVDYLYFNEDGTMKPVTQTVEGVTVPPVGSGAVPFELSQLDYSQVEQGWGQARSNRTVDNHRLTIAGQSFGSGIGTHADSEIPLVLDGKGVTLSGGAGLDDETNNRGSVIFKIVADGKELWNSGLMGPGDAAKKFSVDVSGAKLVMMYVLGGEDGMDWDHADWVDLQVTMLDDAKPKLDFPPVEDMVILTPKPGPEPRITGAKVFGVRPGSPFMFKVSATGDKPMKYSATGLPKGLKIDSATGVITGVLAKEGEYAVKLSAKNSLGESKRDFKIVCGQVIGLTPAMGWNSWNCFASAVTADKVKAAADAMVESGLIDHGWTYINIDDYWAVHRDSRDESLQGPHRDEDGMVLPNPRFPDMYALTDYVHDKGLKIGIYSGPGPWSCGGCVASFDHELQDAKQYAEWGFDYLKYDWCSYNPNFESYRGKTDSSDWNPLRHQNITYSGGDHPVDGKLPFKIMADALAQQQRDIVYSLCQYGMGDVWEWGAEVGGNSWRTTNDITDTWGSMSNIGFNQDGHEAYAGPGHFNDPDMLVVGKVGWGPQLRDSRLSPNEQYTHISLWCLLSSPLLIGCDMTQLDDFTLNLLTNDEVLEVNQDPLGKQASRILQDGKAEVWAKDMEDGSKAVGLFNRSVRDLKVSFKWSDLGIKGEQVVRDLWRQKDVGTFSDEFEATVGRHGVVLIKVTPVK